MQHPVCCHLMPEDLGLSGGGFIHCTGVLIFNMFTDGSVFAGESKSLQHMHPQGPNMWSSSPPATSEVTHLPESRPISRTVRPCVLGYYTATAANPYQSMPSVGGMLWYENRSAGKYIFDIPLHHTTNSPGHSLTTVPSSRYYARFLSSTHTRLKKHRFIQ